MINRKKLKDIFNSYFLNPKTKQTKKLLKIVLASTILSFSLTNGNANEMNQTKEISVFNDFNDTKFYNTSNVITSPQEFQQTSKKNNIEKENQVFEEMIVQLEEQEKNENDKNYILNNINDIEIPEIKEEIIKKLRELKKKRYINYESLETLVKEELEEQIKNSKKRLSKEKMIINVGKFLEGEEKISLWRVAKKLKTISIQSDEKLRTKIEKIGSINDLVSYILFTNKKINHNNITNKTKLDIDFTDQKIENYNDENNIKKTMEEKRQKIEKIENEIVDNEIQKIWSKVEISNNNFKETKEKFDNIKIKKSTKNLWNNIKQNNQNKKREQNYLNKEKVINVNLDTAKIQLLKKRKDGNTLYKDILLFSEELYEHNELKASFAVNSIVQTIMIESSFNEKATNISKTDNSYGLTQIDIRTKSKRGDILRLLNRNKNIPGVLELSKFWKENKNNINILGKMLKNPRINVMVGMIVMENKLKYKNIHKMNTKKQPEMEKKVLDIIKNREKNKEKNLKNLKEYLDKLDPISKTEFFSLLNAQIAYNGFDLLKNTTYLTKILKEKNNMLKLSKNLYIKNEIKYKNTIRQGS